MAQQLGAAAPPVQRRVKSTMICFSQEAAPAGRYAVRVTLYATRSFDFWRRGDVRAQDAFPQKHPDGGTTTEFTLAGRAKLLSAADCLGTLRGMLAVMPQLRSLRLAEDEWAGVVPVDIVPEIVGAARRRDGFTFCFTMKVHLQVIHDERALLMACKEWLASMAPREKDCSICVDGLERESAVVLPGCNHGFHRRCICGWFSRARTCPMCRADVWKAALPVFIEMASTD